MKVLRKGYLFVTPCVRMASNDTTKPGAQPTTATTTKYPPLSPLETVAPGEAEDIESLLHTAKLQVDKLFGLYGCPFRRDAHPKAHGVVKAQFAVDPKLPKDLQVGIFQPGRTFDAWVRFSNAAARLGNDPDRDVRALAIKLVNVPESETKTQDFLTISARRFSFATPSKFSDFQRSRIIGGSPMPYFKKYPFEFYPVFGSMNVHPRTLLEFSYHSITPYKFGESKAVHYCVSPVKTSIWPNKSFTRDPNSLRTDLVKKLKQGPVAFDFNIQFFKNEAETPIENTAPEWKTPKIRLATLTLLQQEFDTEAQNTFAENLSFNPFHTLPVHYPIGGMNRARRVVYKAISQERHERNKVPEREPADLSMTRWVEAAPTSTK